MGRGGLVVIYDDKMLEINKTSNTKLRALYEGGSGIVLTLGDGDFSFSAALASQFNLRFPDGSNRLLATSYDSQSQVMQKYPSTAGVCLDTLKTMKVPVLHNIDGTKLYQTLEVNRYRMMKRPDTLAIPAYVQNCSRIIFNFPNLGNLGANSTQIHQDLLKNVFIQALPLLVRPTAKNRNERGEVHIALRNSVFYQKWDVEQIAISIGYKLHQKDIFKTEHYPGYEEQRTSPGIFRSAPPTAEGATIYRFVLDDQYVEHLQMAGYLDVKPIDTSNLNAYTKSIMPTEADCQTDLVSPENPFATAQGIAPTNSIFQSFTQSFQKDQKDQNGQTGDNNNDAKSNVNVKVKQDQSDVGKFEIKPAQIVGVKLDTSALQKGKLPTFSPSNLPSGSMQYVPVYPVCPAPPSAQEYAAFVKEHKGDEAGLQTKLKQYQPPGLFSFYHSTLSTLDPKARNFRLGTQELRNTIGSSDSLKEQLKGYQNEQLTNGAVLIRVTRATDYERFFHSKLIAENTGGASDKAVPESEGGKKKIQMTKLVSVKKMINGKLVTIKVPEAQAQKIAAKEAPSGNQKEEGKKEKWDLPPEKRLYQGYIVGILSPESASLSSTHVLAIAKGKKAEEAKVKGPSGPQIRKAASQSVDSLGDEPIDQVSKRGKVGKEQANAQQHYQHDELDAAELAEYLPAGTLAHDLALVQKNGYEMGYKEKEALRKQKLNEAKVLRHQKKMEWQAERRVKHCEEKGTEARHRDTQLVQKIQKERAERDQGRHDRKQERRIARDQASRQQEAE